MNRRKFIRVSTSGGLLLLGGPLALSCAGEDDLPFESWNGPSPLLDDEDVRLRIISYGLLAPSFKNTQPWWVDIKGEGITIRPEVQRIPAALDPTGRQTEISLGTFIEALAIASSFYGYEMGTEIFPEGDGTSITSNETTVAICKLTRRNDIPPDPLFSSILLRRTERGPFVDTSLETEHADSLIQTALSSGVSLNVITEKSVVADVSTFVLEAALEELTAPAMRTAVLDHIRFTSEDVRAKRDGMTLSNTGLSGLDRAWLRVRSGLGIETGPATIDKMSELVRDQIGTAGAYGMLHTPGDTGIDHILAGRAFLRMNLHATQLGIAFQPFSRPIESVKASRGIDTAAASQGEHLQCLFRLGYGSDAPPSPRRSLFEIVRI